MLSEIYIEALLVDEELADRVWEGWNRGEMGDFLACYMWLWIAYKDDKDQEEKSR